jgi:putative ubiquitin-RnfH superfamily antitoxin RatB of RatAB toxin-antitoxin module
MVGADALHVEVVYCPGPGAVDRVELRLAPGSTLADALRASGLVERHGLDAGTLRAGIWCKPREPSTPLRERDRIEIYRALTVDPKEARRQRFKRHKAG